MEIKQELETIRGTIVFSVLVGNDEEYTPVSKSFKNLVEFMNIINHSFEELELSYDAKSVKVERVIFSGKTDVGTEVSLLLNQEDMNGTVKPIVHQAELDFSIVNEIEKIQEISNKIIKTTQKKWEL